MKTCMHRYKKIILNILLLMSALCFLCSFAAGSLTYGKQNDDVYALQMRLKELGFFAGEADGYFGDSTQTAINNFQTANSLMITGLADPQTVERIHAEDAITKKEYLDAVRTVENVDLELKKGDDGKQVKKLQTLLTNLGYYTNAINSVYDDNTAVAVCLFQMINGLEVTGNAGSETISLILSPSAIALSEYDMAITLRFGDTGSAVKALQMKLKELGYFSGDCSAKFGKNTQDAVTEYQKWNGLQETGECDVEMRIMLMMGQSVSYAEAIAIEAVSTLTEGDISPSVAKVKEQLTQLGFYTGLIDTEFTHELTEAVYYFQIANSIQTTGCADKATRLLLNSGECTTMEEFTRVMSEIHTQKGDAGHQVVLLQRRLMDLGYYIDSVNGTFDKATAEAVSTFQSKNGIEPTGIADTDTRKYMNSDEALTYVEAVELEQMRIREQERLTLVDALVQEAMSAVTMPYEAGRIGKDKYGNAGLTYAVYTVVDMELSPTIALQYETAKAMFNWNEDASLVEIGDQVFFMTGEIMLTGICVNMDEVVFASPDLGYVVCVENFMENQDYEFVGSVHYF